MAIKENDTTMEDFLKQLFGYAFTLGAFLLSKIFGLMYLTLLSQGASLVTMISGAILIIINFPKFYTTLNRGRKKLLLMFRKNKKL